MYSLEEQDTANRNAIMQFSIVYAVFVFNVYQFKMIKIWMQHALNMIEAKVDILTRQTDRDTSFLSTKQPF